MAWWRGRDKGSGTGGAAAPPAPACTCCDGTLSAGDPRFNLSLPDPVAKMSAYAQETCIRFLSDFMVSTENIGAFTRALLPVTLTDGRTVTFGVWVAIDGPTYRYISELGRDGTDEEYATMEFDGLLANALEPWGRKVLRAEVSVAIPDSPFDRPTPQIISSTHATVTRMLSEPWAPGKVLTGSRAWALRYDADAPPVPHLR
nr:DUF2199 domain-containing protein [Kitasatospora sp. MBT63]